MQRRTVTTPVSSANGVALPRSHSGSSLGCTSDEATAQQQQRQQGAPLRRKRRKRRRPVHAYNPDQWFPPALDRGTIKVLASIGLLVLFSVHVYLFLPRALRTTTAMQKSRPKAASVDHTVHARPTKTKTKISSLRNSKKNRIRNNPHITAGDKNDERSRFSLTPLVNPTDYQQYTIRINTWKRLETLRVSLQHHASCDSVAQIQVVWCIAQGDPPDWLLAAPKVVVELHDENSLNERFHILSEPPPTHGILSLDDDVLRPCVAYDAAFVRWTQHPDRIVGFDARTHETVVNTANSNNQNAKAVVATTWKYGYKSTTEKTNHYSITLTRACFVHVDYLRHYSAASYLKPIRQVVHDHFECEDIAMSFLVSSFTQAQPPLLAPFWAVSSLIKLDQGGDAISGTAQHKSVRDDCVNDFAELLGLKQKATTLTSTNDRDADGGGVFLKPGVLYHNSLFDYGVPATVAPGKKTNKSVGGDVLDEAMKKRYTESIRQSLETITKWQANPASLKEELAEMRVETSEKAYVAGLVPGTSPWEKRFGKKDKKGDGAKKKKKKPTV